MAEGSAAPMRHDDEDEEGPMEGPGQAAPPRRSRTLAAPGALDRLIHERVRLGIVSALAVNDAMSFRDLRDLMDTSDGNLSVHARKLEEAGYLVCTKRFEDRIPRTEYRLTDQGRRALERYLEHMDALIQRVRES